MSFKHSFRTSHAEGLWQIERVPILAEDLTMTVSALNVILDCPIYVYVSKRKM